jgi:outer membrane lipoprotein SlyB
MLRSISAAVLLAAVVALPAQEAAAQSGTLGGAILGGAAGAVIGGAATGRAGGAVVGGVIGAAAGAALGAQLEPRRGGYYWYDNRCWYRYPNGDYRLVSRRNC